MKINGSVLADLGVKKFSFKNIKEILNVSWETTKSVFRMAWTLLKWFFNPTYEGINFIQRIIVFPIVEFFLGGRSAGAFLGKLYNDYFSAKITEKRTGSKAFIAPNFEQLNEIVSEFKIVKSVTILLFVVGYAGFIELFDMISLVSELGAVFGVTMGLNFDSNAMYVLTFVLTAIGYVIHVFSAWLSVLLLRMIFLFMREFNRVDPIEMKSFVADAIEYISRKAGETTDLEVAKIAREAVIESTVIKTSLLASDTLDKSISYLQRGDKLVINRKKVNDLKYHEDEVHGLR